MADSLSSRPGDMDVIEATAAAWLSHRDRGLTAGETAEFVRWLQHDRRHAEVFAELDRVWRACDALARDHSAVNPDDVALRPASRTRRDARRRGARVFARGLLAAAAALALIWIGVEAWPARPPTTETAVGAFHKLDLPDGSVVQLNTDSAVTVDYSGSERRVRLVRGEAHFAVAKDAARPFVVGVNGVAVRAVGTAFNVRVREEALEVVVTEGKVRVDDAARGVSLLEATRAGEPPTLGAGEQALLRTGGAPAALSVNELSAAEIERLLAWQERRLEFEALPLGQVVAEFNRYNRTKLVLADARLAAKRFSGTFRADGIDPFVHLLEESFGVVVERTPGEVRLRSAR